MTYSKAVLKVRQPIEGWFNWLIEKTDFQRAKKVRLPKGFLFMYFVNWPPLLFI